MQVILFEIDCAFFYTNLHELFCQFISWTNWVNSGKFMDNCWISCQVMADIKKVYDDLIIFNLYGIQIGPFLSRNVFCVLSRNFVNISQKYLEKFKYVKNAYPYCLQNYACCNNGLENLKFCIKVGVHAKTMRTSNYDNSVN